MTRSPGGYKLQIIGLDTPEDRRVPGLVGELEQVDSLHKFP
jgi:hypothetical protein